MTTYVLIYNYVDNYLEARTPHRPEHLGIAKGYVEQGQLLMAGAYSSAPHGAILVFNVDDKAIIEEFAKNDPYTKNGVVTSWEIREWNVAVGADRLA